jgi:hypothetical protein
MVSNHSAKDSPQWQLLCSSVSDKEGVFLMVYIEFIPLRILIEDPSRILLRELLGKEDPLSHSVIIQFQFNINCCSKYGQTRLHLHPLTKIIVVVPSNQALGAIKLKSRLNQYFSLFLLVCGKLSINESQKRCTLSFRYIYIS